MLQARLGAAGSAEAPAPTDAPTEPAEAPSQPSLAAAAAAAQPEDERFQRAGIALALRTYDAQQSSAAGRPAAAAALPPAPVDALQPMVS